MILSPQKLKNLVYSISQFLIEKGHQQPLCVEMGHKLVLYLPYIQPKEDLHYLDWTEHRVLLHWFCLRECQSFETQSVANPSSKLGSEEIDNASMELSSSMLERLFEGKSALRKGAKILYSDRWSKTGCYTESSVT